MSVLEFSQMVPYTPCLPPPVALLRTFDSGLRGSVRTDSVEHERYVCKGEGYETEHRRPEEEGRAMLRRNVVGEEIGRHPDEEHNRREDHVESTQARQVERN